MNVRIKFLQKFTDGDIFDGSMKMFQEIEVTEATYQRVLQSGGEVELLGKVVPPSTVKGARTTVTKRDSKGQFVKTEGDDTPAPPAIDPDDPPGVTPNLAPEDDPADPLYVDNEKTITPDKVDD